MRNHSSAAPGPLAPVPFHTDGLPQALEVSDATWGEWDEAVSQSPATDRVTVRGEALTPPKHDDYWLRSILALR